VGGLSEEATPNIEEIVRQVTEKVRGGVCAEVLAEVQAMLGVKVTSDNDTKPKATVRSTQPKNDKKHEAKATVRSTRPKNHK